MGYKSEQQQITSTIRRAGNLATAEVISPAATDAFSGESEGGDRKITAFFVQVAYTNGEIERNPKLVEGVRILLAPLDDSWNQIRNFSDIIKSKGATIVLPSNKSFSINSARVTSPDGITPIVARIDAGG